MIQILSALTIEDLLKDSRRKCRRIPAYIVMLGCIFLMLEKIYLLYLTRLQTHWSHLEMCIIGCAQILRARPLICSLKR